MQYKNIRVDKSLYKNAGGFLAALEKLDPSERYANNGDMSGLDAFQRQLKRFDIKVSGPGSSSISKFFSTVDSAALFPEYVSRAVAQGCQDESVLDQIISARTDVHSMDYRSITTDLSDSVQDSGQVITEGAQIPETNIVLNENLVALKKRGRMLRASYEAIKFQRLDVFTVALRQIGAYIAKAQLADAIEALIGSGDSAAETVSITGSSLAYSDLLKLWELFEDFEMNVLLASPSMAAELLNIPELRDPLAGLGFQAGGGAVSPFGAKLIKTSTVPEGKIIALDKRFALEMVTAGGVQVEYDKLIDTQLERAAVTSICGFSKLFPAAVKVLNS